MSFSAGPFFTPAFPTTSAVLPPPESTLPLEGERLLRRLEAVVPKTRALCPAALNVVIESGFELDGSESSVDLKRGFKEE